MDLLDSRMLIKLLQTISPEEINAESLSCFLMCKDNVVSCLMYGNNNTGKAYWPNHKLWKENAIQNFRYYTDPESVKKAGIDRLHACCQNLKSYSQIISLEEQFIILLDEVFGVYYDSDISYARKEVSRILAELGAPLKDIEYIETINDLDHLSSFLASRAKAKGGFKTSVPGKKQSAQSNHHKNDVDESDLGEISPRESVSAMTMDAHKDALSLCTVADLEKKGLSKLDIAEQLLQNDKALFGDLGDHAGTKEQWAGQMERFGDNWMFLCDGTNVVGNWSCTFLTLEQEVALKNGSMLGVNFTADKAINPHLSSDTEVAIHLLNISLNDGYSTDENWALLWKSFGNRLCELAQKGIFYRSISACAFRPDYEEIFKKYGFKHVASRVGVGEVYLLDLTNGIPDKFRGIMPDTDLAKFYEEHWKTPVIFKQLSSNVPSSEYPTEQELIMISSLVYDTDKYIYRAMMERLQAQKILPRVFASNKDPMFNLDNLFVAIAGDKIIGLILYKQGPLHWNSEHVRKMAMFHGEKLPETLDEVEKEYFSKYSHTDANTISIINCCVHSNWRMGNNRVGTKMMEAFCREHSERMELYVLSETIPAMRIYEQNGFQLVSTCNGFSVDHRELPCGFMVRPAKTTK